MFRFCDCAGIYAWFRLHSCAAATLRRYLDCYNCLDFMIAQLLNFINVTILKFMNAQLRSTVQNS